MGKDLECPKKDCTGGDAARQLRVDVKGFKLNYGSDLTEDIEDDDVLWECIYCETFYMYVYGPSTKISKLKIIREPDQPLPK